MQEDFLFCLSRPGCQFRSPAADGRRGAKECEACRKKERALQRVGGVGAEIHCVSAGGKVLLLHFGAAEGWVRKPLSRFNVPAETWRWCWSDPSSDPSPAAI